MFWFHFQIRAIYTAVMSRMDDDRLPKHLLEWHPRHEKRTRGRKRATWLSCSKEDLDMVTGRVGIDYTQGK